MKNNFLVINALAKDSYDDCHIKGSINVPLDHLESYVKDIPRDAEIIVYCAHYACPVSREAWHLLNNLGFAHIKAYEGGMREWYQHKFPSVGKCKSEYLHEKNNPEEFDKVVATISAQELFAKMKKHELL